MSWFFQPIESAAQIQAAVPGGSKTFAFTLSETEAIAAQAARSRAEQFTLAEIAVLSLAIGRNRQSSASIAETESMTNSITRNRGSRTTITETESMTNSINRFRNNSFTLSEVESLAFAFVRSRSILASIVGTVSHTISLSKGGGSKTFAFSFAEVESMVQAVARSRGVQLTSTEVQTTTIASIARARTLVSTIAEVETITNAVRRTRPVQASIAETEVLTNAVRRSRNVLASITETQTISSALNRLKSITIALAETFGYSFSLAGTAGPKLLSLTITETESHTGSLKRTRTVLSTLSEVIAHAESIVRTRKAGLTIAETEVLSEALRRTRSLQESISEVQTITNALSRSRTASLTIAELESVQAAITKVKLMSFVSAQTESHSFWMDRARGYVWQSTNLLAQSEAFGTSPWQSGASSLVSSNVIPNPINGNIDADKIQENVTTVATYFTRQQVQVYAGQTYTFSAYVKAAERNRVRLLILSGTGFAVDATAYFNLGTGTVGSSGGTSGTSITTLPNGWFRVSITQTASATGLTYFYLQPWDATTSAYAGVLGNGVYVYGAQLQTGTTPSTYAQTFGSAGSQSFESVTASFNRARAYVVPIAETESFSLNFSRLRRQLISITETQGVQAALNRIRSVLQSISNSTGLTFTLSTYGGDPAEVRVLVSWQEWQNINGVLYLMNRSEPLISYAKTSSTQTMILATNSNVVVMNDQLTSLTVGGTETSIHIVPMNTL